MSEFAKISLSFYLFIFKESWGYLKSKLNLYIIFKMCLPLISGGMRAFPWTEGLCLWDWWAGGVLARADAALLERASSHLGGEAQTVLHPSVPGKQLPERIRAVSPEAETGGGEQREPPGGRRGSCVRRDGALGRRLPAGHGHGARLQVVSKHCHGLHLHPAAVHAADEVS